MQQLGPVREWALLQPEHLQMRNIGHQVRQRVPLAPELPRQPVLQLDQLLSRPVLDRTAMFGRQAVRDGRLLLRRGVERVQTQGQLLHQQERQHVHCGHVLRQRNLQGPARRSCDMRPGQPVHQRLLLCLYFLVRQGACSLEPLHGRQVRHPSLALQ